MMRTRCPCCGAGLSLDVLIAHDAGRVALEYAFGLSREIGTALIRYLAMFRPSERALTFERVAKILDVLIVQIEERKIVRNGQTHLAPPAAWVWAIGQMCEARDAGRLTLPLKTHGYLYEVILQWRPEEPAVAKRASTPDIQGNTSKTARAIAILEDRAR